MSESRYFDLTTNFINTKRSNTRGVKNNFTVTTASIALPSNNFMCTLADVRYPTVDLSDETAGRLFSGSTYAALSAANKLVVDRYNQSITLLIACSIVSPIVVNGILGPLIYKAVAGSSLAESSVYHVDDVRPYSPVLSVRINTSYFSEISIQIYRSDTGEPYPFTESETEPGISLILQLEPIVVPFLTVVKAGQ